MVPMWLREHNSGAGHNIIEPTTQPFTCTHKHGHEVLFCGCVSYKEARSQCADGSPEDTQKDPKSTPNQGLFPTSCLYERLLCDARAGSVRSQARHEQSLPG